MIHPSITDRERAKDALIESLSREVESLVARLAAPPAQPDETLPLDYLRGFRDGLEWAADLAEAEDPRTSDWMYDDRNDLAEAIRRGPEMPQAQPAQPAQRLTDEQITQALRRAYYLGQTYWQQADSEFTSEHRKADATSAKFNALIAETIAAAQKEQP